LRFIEGPRGSELLRGLILRAAVRALGIVIDPPVFDDLASLTDAGEPMLVQAFFTVSAVETLNVGVLGRLAGVDEIQLDAVISGPSIQRPRAQFRAVINDQDSGVPSWASLMTSFTPRRPRRVSLRRNSVQIGSASDVPVSRPRTSRRPSVFTPMAMMTATETIRPPRRTLR
jgi:hypothetical protein